MDVSILGRYRGACLADSVIAFRLKVGILCEILPHHASVVCSMTFLLCCRVGMVPLASSLMAPGSYRIIYDASGGVWLLIVDLLHFGRTYDYL